MYDGSQTEDIIAKGQPAKSWFFSTMRRMQWEQGRYCTCTQQTAALFCVKWPPSWKY